MDPVELISLGTGGVTIDQLLTVALSPRITWLHQGLNVGDAGLHPAESVLERFKRWDMPDFFKDFNLTSVAEDGLENLLKVGGDGDGHEYVFGPRSERFYAMWHGEDSFDPVADSTADFIQWVINKRSDHLAGCPWQIFLSKESR
jgi:hypothetical protein